MIKETLEKLENLNPKSLFSKIEADKGKILLTINKEEYNEIETKIVRLDFYPEYTNIFRDDFLFGMATSSDEVITLIYRALNCKLIELDLEEVLYDVWGNEEDGFTVNDQSSYNLTEELCIHTPTMHILLTNKDYRQLFNIYPDLEMEWSDYGIPIDEELTKYVYFGYEFSHTHNGKPAGEIRIAYNKKNINILNSLC